MDIITNSQIEDFNSNAKSLKIEINSNDLILIKTTDDIEIVKIKKFSDCWGYKIDLLINNENIMYKSKVHNIEELKKALKNTILMTESTIFNKITNDLKLLIKLI